MLDQWIDSVLNLIQNNYDINQSLVDKTDYKLFMLEIYQIFIFQQGHHNTLIKTPIMNASDILYRFTEEEWDIFCNYYITKKLQSPLPV